MMLLSWEQTLPGELLHGYEGAFLTPVCKAEGVERRPNDGLPRTTYVGPSPAPPSMVCSVCKVIDRDNDPRFQQGVLAEHTRILALLRSKGWHGAADAIDGEGDAR